MLFLSPGVVGRRKENGAAFFEKEVPADTQELYMILEKLEVQGQDRIVIV
jgi:hypothetical protein